MARGGTWQIDQEAYDRLLVLPYSGWAWEFKRRDPKVHIASNCAAGYRPIELLRPDGSVLIRQPSRCQIAESFGLHFLPNPSRSAFDTSPFWLPEVMSANLDAAAMLGQRIGREDEALNWQKIPGRKAILIVPGRRTKLNIAASSFNAQLAIDEGQSPVPLAIYIKLKIGARSILMENLRCLQDFAGHCRGVEFNFRQRRGYSLASMRNALIALDGHLASVPRRQIANAIFGEKLVAEDWDSEINSYKQRTKRLVDKGLFLMREGYKALL